MRKSLYSPIEFSFILRTASLHFCKARESTSHTPTISQFFCLAKLQAKARPHELTPIAPTLIRSFAPTILL